MCRQAAEVYKDMEAVKVAEKMFAKKNIAAPVLLDDKCDSLQVGNPFNESKQDRALFYDSTAALKRNTEQGLFS